LGLPDPIVRVIGKLVGEPGKVIQVICVSARLFPDTQAEIPILRRPYGIHDFRFVAMPHCQGIVDDCFGNVFSVAGFGGENYVPHSLAPTILNSSRPSSAWATASSHPSPLLRNRRPKLFHPELLWCHRHSLDPGGSRLRLPPLRSPLSLHRSEDRGSAGLLVGGII
jgi:hypothetical protein